jgi:hypothetical protein
MLSGRARQVQIKMQIMQRGQTGPEHFVALEQVREIGFGIKAVFSQGALGIHCA